LPGLLPTDTIRSMTHIQQLTHQINLQRLYPWVIRAGLLLVILQSTSHRSPYVVVGPQQSVETEHPITCVHTRLTDEVEEWKIQRTLEMAREMGATTIVEFFPWAYMEPSQGEYWWGHADMVIEHANVQGLTVIARIGLVPQWALPEQTTDEDIDYSLNYLDPHRDQDFAHFIEAFAERYQGKVDYIQIWNEPNLAFEWGFADFEPQRYVSLMQFAYPAAKRGNPEVTVLAGALAPTLEPVGSPFGMNELDYLQTLYDWGIKDFYDGLAIHTYGFKFPPEEPPAADVLNFRRAELLREVMVQNGDEDKPVYITEMGWNDHPRWTKAVRPSQRITYTIDAFEYTEENWPWVDAMCVWAFRYPAPVRSHPDYFTLVGSDFSPKPIYYELQAWARGFAVGR